MELSLHIDLLRGGFMRKFQKFLSSFLSCLLAIFTCAWCFTQPVQAKVGRTIKIHYNREDVNGWDVWVWGGGVNGFNVPFTGHDKFGHIAEHTFEKEVKDLFYIVRKNDWSEREQSNGGDDGKRAIADTDNEVWVKQGDKTEYTANPDTQGKTTVKIHYNRENIDGWDVWLWIEGEDNSSVVVPFNGKDQYGYIAEHTFDKLVGDKKLGYIVRKNDWSEREQSNGNDGNRFLQSPQTEAWVKQGDKTEYTVNPQALPERKLKIHYNRNDVANWSIWLYGAGLEGKDYTFDKKDQFGPYAEITLESGLAEFKFILHRKEGNEAFAEKEISNENDGARQIQVDAEGNGEVWVKQADKDTYTEEPRPQHDKLKLTVHYHRYDLASLSGWKMLVYANGQTAENGQSIELVQEKDNLYKATAEITGAKLDTLNFKLQRFNGNERINEEALRQVRYFNENGEAEVFISQNDPQLFNTAEEACQKIELVSLTITANNCLELKLNRKVDLQGLLDNGYEFNTKQDVQGQQLAGVEAKEKPVSDTLLVKTLFDLDPTKEHEFVLYLDKAKKQPLKMKASLSAEVKPEDKLFDTVYAYEGELGSLYTEASTEFRVWAPTAKSVNLLLYSQDNDANPEKLSMNKGEKGVYSIKKDGNLDGQRYMYEVTVGDKTNIVVDPYVKATTANGQLGVVVNPPTVKTASPASLANKRPIIYELHVRDFSHDPKGNMQNKGKYLAFTESGTKTDTGMATGLDYLKSLGVTHVQLLPIFDYNSSSVDELQPEEKYNWGYDPINYNTPEGSYSTDPSQPYKRITELQAAIDSLHQNGMGVIMDVVFNHVGDIAKQSFEQIVPGYYFRHKTDGTLMSNSGCGNDTASERVMMRKYIVDSVKYWATTYKLDGFRFDLMGLHDVTTMQTVRDELRKINPNIVILGEGWDMGSTVPAEQKSNQKNADKLEGVGMFNDALRDGVKGSVFNAKEKGFANGNYTKKQQVLDSLGIKAKFSGQSYASPSQLVQYVAAHDNFTLWDKISQTNEGENEETLLKIHRLASAIPLLAQGTPFIHAGQEWARTKNKEGNSYKSPDAINQLDWSRAEKNKELTDYFRELIKIRKQSDLFWLTDFNKVQTAMTILPSADEVIAYKLAQPEDTVLVIHNAKNEVKKVASLPVGKYQILVQNNQAKASGLGEVEIKASSTARDSEATGEVEVEGLSTLVLRKTTKKNPEPSHDKLNNNASKDEGIVYVPSSNESANEIASINTAKEEFTQGKVSKTGELASNSLYGVSVALALALALAWRRRRA